MSDKSLVGSRRKTKTTQRNKQWIPTTYTNYMETQVIVIVGTNKCTGITTRNDVY
jgi:hypothetical protein